MARSMRPALVAVVVIALGLLPNRGALAQDTTCAEAPMNGSAVQRFQHKFVCEHAAAKTLVPLTPMVLVLASCPPGEGESELPPPLVAARSTG